VKLALVLVLSEVSVTFAETVQVPSASSPNWQLAVELDGFAKQRTFVSPDLVAVTVTFDPDSVPLTTMLGVSSFVMPSLALLPTSLSAAKATLVG
jgi:hypothetical protein